MFSDFKRSSFKHKNNKFRYYLRNNIRQLIPSFFFQRKLKRKLIEIKDFDKEYVLRRVNYYNKLDKVNPLSDKALEISKLKLPDRWKVYYFDAYEFLRYFNQNLRALFEFGDVITIPDEPSILKSRPILGDNRNSVVMKLEKIRHFLFVNDKKPFVTKKNMLIGRSKGVQSHRIRFLEMYINHPMCNIGQIKTNINPQFIRNRLTISEHLEYKFILCLEGWDVASNLKWVMSSNSLAVMPNPTYETWFMEGTLIPNFHFVCIKDDYSDLEERLNYYITHTNEALKIIDNAHQYIQQFKNRKREDLISLLVLEKYFEKTEQKVL
jgi:hypothetical protein